MKVEELTEFKKDLQRLARRYRSLPEDVNVVKKVVAVSPGNRPPFTYPVSVPEIGECSFLSIRIACKSIKGKGLNSNLRIVYAWFKQENRIVLTEIYLADDKKREDKKRILHNFA
jgi:hypothetical protein